MSLIPRNQLAHFESLFGDFFPGLWRHDDRAATDSGASGMRIDVHDTGSAYEIHADLPGVKKKDIEITLADGVLTIAASKNTADEKKENGRVIWRERSSGAITRSFSVPRGTTYKDVNAIYTDGVLTLTVNRKNSDENESKAKRISIK